MRTGAFVAGAVFFLLGCLLAAYLCSAYSLVGTFGGYLVSTFQAYIVFDAILFVFSLVLLGYGSTNPSPESRATQSNSPRVVEESIRGSLDFTVLRALSQRQSAAEIATQTGVAPPIISAKIGQLFQEGYITENNYLTEKGFDALNRR